MAALAGIIINSNIMIILKVISITIITIMIKHDRVMDATVASLVLEE